ncbi:PHB depolymerase family esterase [Sphingomonas sp. RP10(2022)]|uniref:PHB depolymerase family esterase n=1 Tax=Sphingomonas liriopis TaxID=2949094 RepID=A0A9X2HR84_9SPHN|nr:PHB depolymerase family esterase [Sphingomonas liriopis]MCP3736006.1 PHB depolymerase family esterase [Sphingomonas liriopis]
MRRLSDTIGRLVAARGVGEGMAPAGTDRLTDLTGFGRNPGNLRARLYVPASVGPRPALVVVLHGCTQTAAGYDIGSGWSRLADEAGFVLLFPEQQRANNPNLCFNWFATEDMSRDHGEAFSIREMIVATIAAHDVDSTRVFVTGLSAGGAMTAVMLATYPELFAGGAVIGGLPYGTAAGVVQALDRMRGHAMPDAAALDTLARGASTHHGGWPTLSIWHGDADATVHAANAEAILAQWRGLHDVPEAPSSCETIAGHPHRTWRDAGGRAVIEDHRILGMGHGTPIATRGPEACGTAGAFMLDVGVSSTRRIAAFWGIAPMPAAIAAPATAPAPQRLRSVPGIAVPAALKGPATVINDALRAAGLLR